MEEVNKKKYKILESHVKQLNTYGNGVGVLVTREARSLGLKSGDMVEVKSVIFDGKKMIVIEKAEKTESN